jgi:hypothetical protein
VRVPLLDNGWVLMSRLAQSILDLQRDVCCAMSPYEMAHSTLERLKACVEASKVEVFRVSITQLIGRYAPGNDSLPLTV